MNYPDNCSYSKAHGDKYRFLEPQLPLKENSPYINPYLKPTLPEIDLLNIKNLPIGKIFAFTEELKLYKDFDTSAEAAQNCGLKHYYNVTRNINNRYIDCAIEGKNC